MLGPELQEMAFVFLLVFIRVSAALIIIPAIGERFIPARSRVVLAGAISLVSLNFLSPQLPEMPAQTISLVGLLFTEITIGVIIGALARIIMSALHVAGTIIGFQVGLAAAQQFDPNQGSQGATISAFLSLLGTMMVFALDLHHLLIASIVNSYALFVPGQSVLWGDFANIGVEAVSTAFLIGLQLSAPFLVYAMIFNVSLGLIGRMMPQLPVFFVGLPLNVMMGFLILAMVMGTLLMWFAGYFESQVKVMMP